MPLDRALVDGSKNGSMVLRRKALRQMDLDPKRGEPLVLRIPHRLQGYGELAGREASPLTETQSVEASAGGNRGQKEIERCRTGVTATVLLGLIGVDGVALETRASTASPPGKVTFIIVASPSQNRDRWGPQMPGSGESSGSSSDRLAMARRLKSLSTAKAVTANS